MAITLAGLMIVGFVVGQESPAPNVSEPLQSPIEVQTRGPLHEAFAQPLEEKPLPGEIVPKEPPPLIQEQPPEVRPDLENAEWIPGYWAWDADRQDFLWISGVYRVAPRGRTFVPGYWSQTDDGWRWIPGFWSDSQRSEVPYAPEPPAPLSIGPTTQSPDENAAFIPGVWVYNTNRFTWRPGYWAAVQVGRVWTPPRYIWTPNGYLFIDGFWDEPYDTRGMIFAPVCFHRPLWRDSSWCYRPDHVVSLSFFFDSAFIRGGAFYFGNYYNPTYAQRGYRPWFNGAGRHDPAFAYHGWQNRRTNPNWAGNAQATYANRSEGRIIAPPSTFAQQRTAKTPAVVTPLNQVAANSAKFVRATPAQIEAQQKNAQRIRDLGVNRKVGDVAVVQQTKTNRVAPTGEGRVFKVPTTTPPVVSQTQPMTATPKGPASEPKLVAPAPKVVTPIAPKLPGQGKGLPKAGDPKVIIRGPDPTPSPKFVSPPPSAPKAVSPPPSAPKFTAPPPSVPKAVSPPPSVPKAVSPPPSAPKAVSPPPSAPKFTAPPPSVPKAVSPPPSAPKFTAPPPSAPKFTAPPPRPAPPPAPRPSPPPPPSPPRTVSPPPRESPSPPSLPSPVPARPKTSKQ